MNFWGMAIETLLMAFALFACTLWGVYCGTMLAINPNNKPYLERWTNWVKAHSIIRKKDGSKI